MLSAECRPAAGTARVVIRPPFGNEVSAQFLKTWPTHLAGLLPAAAVCQSSLQRLLLSPLVLPRALIGQLLRLGLCRAPLGQIFGRFVDGGLHGSARLVL